MKITVLFFSSNPSAHILALCDTLGVDISKVQSGNDIIGNPRILGPVLSAHENAVCIIDSHFGTTDAQLMGELRALEKKGVSAMRKKILSGEHIPESIKLLRDIHTLEPKAHIIFLTHKPVGEEMVALLRGLGVKLIINDNESLSAKGLALDAFLKETKTFGKIVKEGVKDLFGAGKGLVKTFRDNAARAGA